MNKLIWFLVKNYFVRVTKRASIRLSPFAKQPIIQQVDPFGKKSQGFSWVYSNPINLINDNPQLITKNKDNFKLLDPANNPISSVKNMMYSLHYYSGTHKQVIVFKMERLAFEEQGEKMFVFSGSKQKSCKKIS